MSTERDAELARELSQNESLKAIDEAMPARLERLKKIEQIRRRNLRRQMWGSLCTMLVLVILVTFAVWRLGVYGQRKQLERDRQVALEQARALGKRLENEAMEWNRQALRSNPAWALSRDTCRLVLKALHQRTGTMTRMQEDFARLVQADVRLQGSLSEGLEFLSRDSDVGEIVDRSMGFAFGLNAPPVDLSWIDIFEAAAVQIVSEKR